MMIIRSAVSRSFGSKCLKKLGMLSCFVHGGFGFGFCGCSAGQGTGVGFGGSQQGGSTGGGAMGGRGGFGGLCGSGILCFLYEPSGCGMYRLYMLSPACLEWETGTA